MTFDAVVVPGAGLLPGGTVPPWVANRLEVVLESAHTARYVILLSAGTVHKPPPLDRKGYPIFESVAAADWLIARGYDPTRILTETASLDTVGNAYFLRAIHTDPRGWRKLLVVNSEFHIPRTRAIFEWVFGLHPVNLPYELQFRTVPDVGMSEAVRTARQAKERDALHRIRPTMAAIRSLAELHDWLFTEHGVYASAHAADERAPLPQELLDSY